MLVPQVDADGNDLGGVRLPEVAVPLGTYTGWNVSVPPLADLHYLAGLRGSFEPFARTRAERERWKDPRLSIDERYANREDYLARVSRAAQDLVRQRFLLAADVPALLRRAAALWDAIADSPRDSDVFWLLDRRQPLAEPDRERFDRHFALGDRQGDGHQFFWRRHQFMSVELGEHQGGMRRDTLVAVDEGVVERERMHERGSLAGEILVQVLAPERHRRASQCRFESASVTQPRAASVAPQLDGVQRQDLLEGQVTDRHFASSRNARSYRVRARSAAVLNRFVTLPPSR